MSYRLSTAVFIAIAAGQAAGQISIQSQERWVRSQASVSSGDFDDELFEAADTGPFSKSADSAVSGPQGAGAHGIGSQDSVLGATSITASLGAYCAVQTGSTFVTGDAEAQSSFLTAFSLGSATAVSFNALAEFAFLGRNPDGEPSDLYSQANFQLIDSNEGEVIAGFFIRSDEGDGGSASYVGTLPAGDYVILASLYTHAFSADLLGPPARSGWGDATGSVSLTVVPAPTASMVLAAGLLRVHRRKR